MKYNVILNPPIEDDLPDDPDAALTIAVERGVQCENGVYRFLDPAISIPVLCNLDRIRPLLKGDWWKDDVLQSKEKEEAGEKTLLIPESSFGKPLEIENDEYFWRTLSARVLTRFLLINVLSGGPRALGNDRFVRSGTSEPIRDALTAPPFYEVGNNVVVGFDTYGFLKAFYIQNFQKRPNIGIALNEEDWRKTYRNRKT